MDNNQGIRTFIDMSRLELATGWASSHIHNHRIKIRTLTIETFVSLGLSILLAMDHSVAGFFVVSAMTIAVAFLWHKERQGLSACADFVSEMLADLASAEPEEYKQVRSLLG